MNPYGAPADTAAKDRVPLALRILGRVSGMYAFGFLMGRCNTDPDSMTERSEIMSSVHWYAKLLMLLVLFVLFFGHMMATGMGWSRETSWRRINGCKEDE